MKNSQCGKIKPHPAHIWREDRFFMFRKHSCNGVPIRTEEALAEDFWNNPPVHKHRLKLTGWAWSGLSTNDILGPATMLHFTCLDECKKPDGTPWKYEITRCDYDGKVLKRPELKLYSWHT